MDKSTNWSVLLGGSLMFLALGALVTLWMQEQNRWSGVTHAVVRTVPQPQRVDVTALNQTIQGRSAALRNLGLALPEAREPEIALLQSLQTQGEIALQELEEKVSQMASTSDQRAKVQRIIEQTQSTQTLTEDMLALIKANKKAAFNELLYQRYDPVAGQVLKALGDISAELDALPPAGAGHTDLPSTGLRLKTDPIS